MEVELVAKKLSGVTEQERAAIYALPQETHQTPAQKLASGTMANKIRNPEWLNKAVWTATVKEDNITAVGILCGTLYEPYGEGMTNYMKGLHEAAIAVQDRTIW